MLGPGVNVLAVYISVTGGERTWEFATRFSDTWLRHPPDYPCKPVVVFNGGQPDASFSRIFSGLWPSFHIRPNVGADIGAYMDVCQKENGYDAVLCMGESVYFHRRGWLQRIREVWDKHGPGLYGFFTSNLVTPHLNTTAFLCPPKTLAAYPEIIVTREQRYEFEHGQRPFWRRVQGLGLPVRLITWDGDYSPGEWRAPNNILWKGTQSNCLFFCIHTDRYFNADAAIKRRWEKHADAGL